MIDVNGSATKLTLKGASLSGDALRVVHPPTHGYENLNDDWPWVMVPDNESRTLTLNLDTELAVTLLNVDSEGYSVRPKDMFRVRLYGNQLRIHGGSDFRDVPVDVHQPGRRLRIWVSIKKERTVPIVVQYVEHGPLLKTRTTRKHLRDIVNLANEILVAEANVHLWIAHERDLTYEVLGKRLGFVVPYRERRFAMIDELQLIKNHKIRIEKRPNDLAPLNLFLVRRLGRDKEGNDVMAATGVDDGCCVFEDLIKPGDLEKAGCLLAHEVGHHLGLDHNPAGKKYLMYAEIWEGKRLARFEIEKITGGRGIAAPSMGVREDLFA